MENNFAPRVFAIKSLAVGAGNLSHMVCELSCPFIYHHPHCAILFRSEQDRCRIRREAASDNACCQKSLNLPVQFRLVMWRNWIRTSRRRLRPWPFHNRHIKFPHWWRSWLCTCFKDVPFECPQSLLDFFNLASALNVLEPHPPRRRRMCAAQVQFQGCR